MVPAGDFRRFLQRLWLALTLAVLVAPSWSSALAQDTQDPPAGEEEDAAPPAPPEPTPETPYDERLERLGEIVGSIQYLREVCETESADTWRSLMQDLIEAEAPEADRKARLTAAYNRGYRTFASVYRECTPQALIAEQRYRDEGATLASEIIARFGN